MEAFNLEWKRVWRCDTSVTSFSGGALLREACRRRSKNIRRFFALRWQICVQNCQTTQQDRLGKPTRASDLTKTTLGACSDSGFVFCELLLAEEDTQTDTFSGGALESAREV